MSPATCRVARSETFMHTTSSHRKTARATPKGRGPAYWQDRITHALMPGTFCAWRDVSSFFSGLDAVLDELVDALPARDAAKWIEVLYAGLTAKMDEIHDDGKSSMFADRLAVAWISARNQAGADVAATVRTLLGWGETDRYGLMGTIRDDLLKALGARGRKVVVQLRSRDVELAKRVARLDGNAGAYEALCDSAAASPFDALALAEIAIKRNRFEEAATWIERGLNPPPSASASTIPRHDLIALKKSLLRKTGRSREAQDLEWAEFQSRPSSWLLDALFRHVPRTEREAWRQRALDAARKHGFEALLDVGTALKAVGDVAAACAGQSDSVLEGTSHTRTEPAAALLRKAHPLESARLEAAAGFRVVTARKSQYYGAAVRNFERARAAFHAANAPEVWNQVEARLRRNHARQSSFMARFEPMAARRAGEREPSFLDIAVAKQRASLRALRRPNGTRRVVQGVPEVFAVAQAIDSKVDITG